MQSLGKIAQSSPAEVARLVFSTNNLAQADFAAWYEGAPPEVRAGFLQAVASHVAKSAPSLRQISGSARFFLIETCGNEKARVRASLPAAQHMLINADLAHGAGVSNLNSDLFEQLLRSRMLSILEEALLAHEDFIMCDLYLFRREDGTEIDPDVHRGDEDGSLRNIPVRHAFGIKCPAESAMDEGVKSRLKDYPVRLDGYLKNWGTSISLEGHIDDKPNEVQIMGRMLPKIESSDIKIVASYSPRHELVAPRDETKIGDYLAYFDQAVPALLDVKSVENENCLLLHFMEGIDVEFAAGANRKGTVCHMFLLRRLPPAASPLELAAERAIQRMLLRLCGFYAAAEADLNTQDAVRQSKIIEEQARRSESESVRLRDATRTLSGIVGQLQVQIDSIAELIEVNFMLTRFNDWLRDIGPLFKSGEPVEVFPTSGSIGRHNEWGKEQLAAALWLFAKPSTDRLSRQDLNVSPDTAWQQLHVGMKTVNDFKDNKALSLLHRLDPNFANFLHIDSNMLERCFNMFKSWYKAEIKSGLSDHSTRKKYCISEIIFLLGDNSFLDVGGEGSGAYLQEGVFDFPIPHMLESLSRFTAVIDETVGQTTNRAAAGVTKIEAAILPASGKAGNAPRGHPADPNAVSFFRDEVGRPDIKRILNKLDGLAGWLHLRIFQSREAVAAAAKREIQEAADVLDPAFLGTLYSKLFATIAAKASLSHTGPREPKASIPERRARSSSNETSDALAKALGLTLDFASPDAPQGPLERKAKVLDIQVDRDSLGGWPGKQPVLVIYGARRQDMPVALVSADLRRNCFEILIAPDEAISTART